MKAVEHSVAGWPGVLGAGLAGGCLPLAFAPVDWAVLAVVAPAVLFYIADRAPLRRALQAGYAFGLGLFGVGVSWVFVSINDYGGAGALLSGLVTVGFVVLLAVFPLLVVLLGRWVTGSAGVRLLLAFPAAWVLLEWVRIWLFTGFPWLFLGYAGLDTPLAGLAPVFGVLGGSLAVAGLAGVLAYVVLWPGRRAAAGLAGALAVVCLAGIAADRAWNEPVGEPLEVALLQGNYPQDFKWDPANRKIIRQGYAQLTADNLGAELIVWPETALPELYANVATRFLEPLAARVREAGGILVLGIPRRDGSAAGEPLYNSVAVMNKEPAFYAKHHLVPYGEYVPLRNIFGRSLDFLGAPMADYRRGPLPEAVAAGEGLQLGITVCYEAAYPQAVRRVAQGADLLVNVSNDAWFGDSLAPHQHLQKARQRAAETRRWMVRSTNTGITAVIDHFGTVVASGPQFERTVVTAQVERRSGKTPYMVVGDWPVVVILILTLGTLLVSTQYPWASLRRVE